MRKQHNKQIHGTAYRRPLAAPFCQDVTNSSPHWWSRKSGAAIRMPLDAVARRIDNAEAKPVIRSVCAKLGYACPEICTPKN